MAEKKEGFVNVGLPMRDKKDLGNEILNIKNIRTVNVEYNGETRPSRIYETENFAFFGSSIMDKAKEEDVLNKPVRVVKVKNYYAFADVPNQK
jgi:hypothetical protein